MKRALAIRFHDVWQRICQWRRRVWARRDQHHGERLAFWRGRT